MQFLDSPKGFISNSILHSHYSSILVFLSLLHTSSIQFSCPQSTFRPKQYCWSHNGLKKSPFQSYRHPLITQNTCHSPPLHSSTHYFNFYVFLRPIIFFFFLLPTIFWTYLAHTLHHYQSTLPVLVHKFLKNEKQLLIFIYFIGRNPQIFSLKHFSPLFKSLNVYLIFFKILDSFKKKLKR